MAIGVAMLGFGASGTALALLGAEARARAGRRFPLVAALAAAALVASPALAHLVPLDPTQLAWDGRQWARLGLVYLCFALPFALAALGILLALMLEPERPGLVYGASFVGGGMGASAALAALWLLPPGRALAIPALLGALGAVAAAPDAWAAVALGIVGLALARPPWRLTVTPYKGLPQVEAYPDARRVGERSSPVGWVVAVGAPAFRYAPGLSLDYRGAFPQQTALFVDGELAGAAPDPARGGLEMLEWLPTALPYALGDRERVLVLGAGGGLEVASAVAHRAHRVTAVELSPELVRLARELSPGVLGDARVVWIAGDARGFVARTHDTFDLITLAPGAAFGTAAGMHALSEDFLHTVEAYEAYLGRLSPRGVLAVTRWLVVPPRASVRAVLSAAAALRRVRPEAVRDGLVVARSWGTVTVLAKPAGFHVAEVRALRAWASIRGVDLDWYPGLARPEPGFHRLDDSALSRATAAALAGPEAAARFAAAFPFAVAPATDARPYPHHFVRLGSLAGWLRESRGTWLPFAEWGPIALVATLVQSGLLAGLLLLAPIAARRGAGLHSARVVAYFGAIGFAYLAAELATIQQLGLLLGHPVYAVAVALAAFLACSGAGSMWSDRLTAARGWTVGAGLAGLLAAAAVGLLPLVHVLEAAPLIWRGAAAVLAIGPLAFGMGAMFPVGLRTLAADDAGRIAWAWAANGVASVVAAPLAALVALEAGSPALLVLGGLGYGAAATLAHVPTRAS